jgi:integral membrane sensor domain MASE1
MRYVFQLLGVAGVYVASGKLGLDLAFASHSVTAVWPPTGIALAALVLGGYRLWPAVALGALLTNIDTGVPAVTVLGITLGNTLEGLTGAYLLRRVADFRPSLDRVRDVLALVSLGAMISTMVSASIGVTSLLIGNALGFSDLPSVWRTWWLGDMGGDLIVAPALLVAATHRPLVRGPGKPWEAVVLTFLVAGVSVLIFSQHTTFVYVVFPFLIWAALRFWQPGAAVASLIVAGVAVAFTANGKGPFATSGPDDRLLLAQTLVAVAETTALLLAAVTSERRRAEDSLGEIAATLQHSLLPPELPAIPGWEASSHYRPAGVANEVGGDFYDLFAIDGGWMAVIGDVAGKGAQAAALTSLARYTLRTAATLLGEPATGAVRHLNRVLYERPELSLCSAVCVRLREQANGANATIVCAGHTQPYVVRDGVPVALRTSGELAGAFDDMTLEPVALDLSNGDVLVLYTDGVTDTLGALDRFGTRRLEHALSGVRSPQQAVERIERALANFQEGVQRDDRAILAIMCT